jgi:hypothetical protein
MDFVTPNPGKPTYMFGLVTTGIDPIETFDTGWYHMVYYIALVAINVFVCQELACE